MKSIYKYHGYFLAIICFLFIAGCHTIEQLQLDTEYKSNAPLTISPQILRFNQINTNEFKVHSNNILIMLSFCFFK